MLFNRSDREVSRASFNRVIVLYEANCILCTRVTRFLQHRDKTSSITFMDINTEIGTRFKESLSPEELKADSIVLLLDGRTSVRSRAIIRLSKYLRFPWSMISVARFFPASLQENIYVKATRNKYLFFRIKSACFSNEKENLIKAG
jgi:predicted DCC family thiol-disulfide oxidoreductase YuxK